LGIRTHPEGLAMPHRPVPPDAPADLRLRGLGGDDWLADRRYFLADDGSVWCRQASYVGLFPPRWRRVLPEEQQAVVLNGWTLAQTVATLTAPPEEEPTDRERKTPPVNL
jgi:hypothetical protein